MNPLQGTIAKKTTFAGVGLHTGSLIDLEISPAAAHTGIVFQRSDIDDAPLIVAHPFNVSSTQLCTTIGDGSSQIATIEHLMAAFAGLGIDNAYVRVSGPEIPILDGSSAPFYDSLCATGIELLESPRRLLIVKEDLEIRYGDQWIKVEPSAGTFDISATIDFDSSDAIGRQTFHYRHSDKNFLELCEARTFCHINDVNAMRSVGLAKGGSLDNAIVVNDTEVVNAEGLRFSDEFVRHKILDCVGDLGMMGGRLVGNVSVHKGGHKLHVELAHKLLSQHDKYLKIIECHDTETSVLDFSYETPLVMESSARNRFHR